MEDVANAQIGTNAQEIFISENATGNSKQYLQSQGSRMDDFVTSGLSNPDLAEFFKRVDDDLVENGPNGELAFVFVRVLRIKNNFYLRESIEFMNKLVVNWFWRACFLRDEVTPMQPNSVGTYLRTLFAALKAHTGLPYSLKDFKGFPGSIESVTKEYWTAVTSGEDPFSRAFGTRPNRKQFMKEEHDQVRDYIRSPLFSIQSSENHRQALFFTQGTFFGLRGRKEHRDSRFSHYRFGKYPFGHEFAGMEYVERHMEDDTKKNKTTLGMYPLWCGCVCLRFYVFISNWPLFLQVILMPGSSNRRRCATPW
jgi:hypothetical protein